MIDLDPDLLTYLEELFSSENMFQLLQAEKERMYGLSSGGEDRKTRMMLYRGIVLETMAHYFADEAAWAAIEKLEDADYETAPVHQWIRDVLQAKTDLPHDPLTREMRNRCKTFAVHGTKLSPPMQRIYTELERLVKAIAASADDLMLKGKLSARHWAIAAIYEVYVLESTPKDTELWKTFAPNKHDQFVDSDWTVYFLRKAI